MSSDLVASSAAEKRRFAGIAKSCPVKCKYVQQNVTSLADYFAAIGGIISSVDTFWFRGHPESTRSLKPAALRPPTVAGRQPRILDPQTDRELILKFLKSGPRESKRRRYPIAVNPVWGSERIIVQRGTFTLHGAMFSLDKARVPSLVAVPILKESKPNLRNELRRVGVDEMTLFPELEHSCRHLSMCRGLMDFD